MLSISSFRSIENKDVVCRGKYCMKKRKVCEFLREQAKIINLKKKKMKSLKKSRRNYRKMQNSAKFVK